MSAYFENHIPSMPMTTIAAMFTCFQKHSPGGLTLWGGP